MKVNVCMTHDVRTVKPEESVFEAAKAMADAKVGALPVAEEDQLIGMITDRDIVVRWLANGMAFDAMVRDVMSPNIKYCYEDDNVEDVLLNMSDIQVRRLPVFSREKRLVGIVSLGDLSDCEARAAGEALAEISRPDGDYTHPMD
jgi:CBS domain-containing protein